MLLQRQRSQCKNCAKQTQLKPFASCDADHVVAVSRGGKTVSENMQLLCVTCHREKSAREAASCTKLIDLGLQRGVFHADCENIFIKYACIPAEQ